MPREAKRAATPSAAIREEARAAADEVQRRRIAQCVCRVIDKEGLEGTTLRRIAAELGCTTGLIAHYFPSKDALLALALDTASRGLGRAVCGGRVPRDLPDQLEAFLDALPFDEEQRVYWRVYMAYRSATAAQPGASPEALRWGQAMYEALRGSVARELGRPYDDPRVALIADALEALMDGIGVAATVDPERYSRERVRQMVQACARGLLSAER